MPNNAKKHSHCRQNVCCYIAYEMKFKPKKNEIRSALSSTIFFALISVLRKRFLFALFILQKINNFHISWKFMNASQRGSAGEKVFVRNATAIQSMLVLLSAVPTYTPSHSTKLFLNNFSYRNSDSEQRSTVDRRHSHSIAF